MTEEQVLNNVITNTANTVINTSNHLPHIYTAIVDSVQGSSVLVHFASDVNTKMTFQNKSGYTPLVGQGVYILTTGGSNITGGFVVGTCGSNIQTIDNLYQTIQSLNNAIQSLNNTIATLTSRISSLESRVSNLENQ